MQENIEQRIIQLVAEQMGVDPSEITCDTRFVEDLDADSLDIVELVMRIEEEFEFSIDDQNTQKGQAPNTIGDLIDCIKGKHDDDNGNAGVASPLRPRPKPPEINVEKSPPPPET